MPTITKLDILLLKENPDNPRTITEAKFQALVESVRQFPQMLEARPIAYFEAPEGKLVIGGNMRLRACKAAGMTEVAAIDLSEYTEAQRREFVIKDNVGFGEWEWDKIVADWPEAPGWGLDIPEWAIVKPEAVEDDFEIPDEIETDIVLGDLFEIGEHRLLCGSSTEADAVGKLLNGKEPYLMVTDPPYGVNYDPSWRDGVDGKRDGSKSPGRSRGKVNNDHQSDWTEAWGLSPSKVAYVWHGALHSSVVAANLEACNFNIRSQIIWVKSSLVFGRGNYHWQHEPCWYAVKKGSKGNWCGDHKQTTIWEMKSLSAARGNVDDGKTNHSTQKPIEAMLKPMVNHDGDVYDPFLGSGTTMVAAHQLNRKCYGMELDPKYCQVIVDRMRKLDPALVIKKNGVTL